MRIVKILSIFIFMATVSLSAQEFKEYKVQKGETLKDVADKFKMSYLTLLRANKGLSRKPDINTVVKVPTEFFKKKKHPIDFRSNNPKDFYTNFSREKKDSVIVHVVKPKETLYSLSKQYNVSISTLIKKNSFLTLEGLKIGQELRFPRPKKNKDLDTKTHEVNAKETLYSISKQYNVSIEDLKDANFQDLSEGLKLGTILNIPENKKEEINKNSKKHLINKGETLYSISKSYGISLPELLAVNKTIVVDSLLIGSELNLPSKVVAKVNNQNSSPIYKQTPVRFNFEKGSDLSTVLKKYGVDRDSLESINPGLDSILNSGGELFIGFKKSHLLFQEYQSFKKPIITNKKVNALIMLPFNFKKSDTLAGETLFRKANGLPSMVADFYMGAQAAIDSLKKIGVNLNLSVVDTEKSVKTIESKMEELKKIEPNVIIGPLYTDNVKYITHKFPTVPVYYPIYSKKLDNFSANNLYKTIPKKDIYKKNVVSYIQENRKGQHLIIIGDKKYKDRLDVLKRKLIKTDDSGNAIKGDITILNPEKGYIAKDEFLKKIKLEQDNWILITENDNVMASDVFNNARSIPRDTIKETPIKILSFEKLNHTNEISYESLAKYKYTYSTDKVEYDELQNKYLGSKFRKKNNSFPSDYALKGFNVTFDGVLRVLEGDLNKASLRHKQAFYYEDATGELVNENQAIFVNSIENTEKEGLKIIRLR